MSLFSELQTKAAAEIAALKADTAGIEARIEKAFNLGVLHHAMQAIAADATTLEQKIKAAVILGQSSNKG